MSRVRDPSSALGRTRWNGGFRLLAAAGSKARRGAGQIVPGATVSAYLAGDRRLAFEALCSFDGSTGSLLADITLLSKAIWTTWLAKVLDMNVMTFLSLLSRLSHHRNGLSTHPPSKLGMLPS